MGDLSYRQTLRRRHGVRQWECGNGAGPDKGGGSRLEPGSQISVFLRGQIELRVN